MTEANFKKFFNYQLVNIRNVSNEKSGSHCQNSDVDEYNSDWGKMRLQMRLQITNVFALLIISMPLRLKIMLTKNLSDDSYDNYDDDFVITAVTEHTNRDNINIINDSLCLVKDKKLKNAKRGYICNGNSNWLCWYTVDNCFPAVQFHINAFSRPCYLIEVP